MLGSILARAVVVAGVDVSAAVDGGTLGTKIKLDAIVAGAGVVVLSVFTVVVTIETDPASWRY